MCASALNLQQMIEMQQALMESVKPWLDMLGIELYVDRIVLNPEDCPEECIDYVWRIRCRNPEVCGSLREEVLKHHLGEGSGGGGEEE